VNENTRLKQKKTKIRNKTNLDGDEKNDFQAIIDPYYL
jgi:hypothetical protein